MKGHQWRRHARGTIFSLWVRVWGGQAGKNIMVDIGVHLRNPPGPGWIIGDGVYLGRGVILDVQPGARLSVGHRTKVMQYAVIGAENEITIGDESLIAEFTTIRDADHGIDVDGLITRAPMVSSPVSIGNNVWIARGVAVLAGSHVGDGCVIGANSMVRGVVPPESVAVGAPVRVIRRRGARRPV